MTSILPFVDEETVDQLDPRTHINLGLRKVAAVLDGKDFLTETPRKRSGSFNRCAILQDASRCFSEMFNLITPSLCATNRKNSDPTPLARDRIYDTGSDTRTDQTNDTRTDQNTIVTTTSWPYLHYVFKK